MGENPTAADTMGINVKMTRFIAVLIGAFLAGLAGAYFEIGYLQTFQFDIILGRGFVALGTGISLQLEPVQGPDSRAGF